MKSIKLFAQICIIFSFALNSMNSSAADDKTKEPEWLQKLSYSQRHVFYTCPSIYVNAAKNSELTKASTFDYYGTDPETLKWKELVEGAHFTAGVRQGKYGNAGSLEGDLDYVLRHFPNHPQALYVMGNLQASDRFNPRRSTSRKDYFFWSIDCYLKRAIELNGTYASTHLVAAILLHKGKNYKQAEESYLRAASLDPENAEIFYNLGLMYFETQKYIKAKEYAVKAADRGYPLTGLMDKLKKSNHW